MASTPTSSLAKLASPNKKRKRSELHTGESVKIQRLRPSAWRTKRANEEFGVHVDHSSSPPGKILPLPIPTPRMTPARKSTVAMKLCVAAEAKSSRSTSTEAVKVTQR